MYNGVFGGPIRLSYWYAFMIIIVLADCVACVVYCSNLLAIRLDDPVGDRWVSTVFWHFAVSVTVVPANVLTLILMYNNLTKLFYWIHFLAMLWCDLFIAYFLIAMIIPDWANCENVSYCRDVNYPPTQEKADNSFLIAFYCLIWLLGARLVWTWFNVYLKNRVSYRFLLDFFQDENRSPVGVCGGATSYVSSPIGTPVGPFHQFANSSPSKYIGSPYTESQADLILAHCVKNGRISPEDVDVTLQERIQEIRMRSYASVTRAPYNSTPGYDVEVQGGERLEPRRMMMAKKGYQTIQ